MLIWLHCANPGQICTWTFFLVLFFAMGSTYDIAICRPTQCQQKVLLQAMLHLHKEDLPAKLYRHGVF